MTDARPLTCDWRPTGEFDRHGKPYHKCSRCPRRWAFHTLAAEVACLADRDGKPVRPAASELIVGTGLVSPEDPPRHTAETWPCAHRQAATGAMVDCGCGGEGVKLAVYGCAVHGVCTVVSPGRSARIDGKKVTVCIRCDDRR